MGFGGGGKGAAVASVTANDASLVIAPTTGAVKANAATLDVLASTHPPVAAVSFNGQKGTNQAPGSASTDSATFGQIPTSLPPSGGAGGDLTGTFPNPTIAKIAGQALSGTPTTGQGYVLSAGGLLVPSNVVESVGNIDGSIIVNNFASPNPSVGTGTLDAIATAKPPVAAVGMNAQKITNLAAGTVPTDAAQFGQLPTVFPGGPGSNFISGRWYPRTVPAVNNLLVTASQIHALPFLVGVSRAFTAIGVNASVAGVGGVVRLGIYADNGSNYPGAKVLDAGTVSAVATGALIITGIAQTLTPGLYWLVCVGQGGTTQPTLNASASGSINGLDDVNTFGTTGPGIVAGLNGYTNSPVAGALPATFPAGGTLAGNIVLTNLEAT